MIDDIESTIIIVIKSVTLSVISSSAIIGNILLFLIIYLDVRLRTPTNMLLLCLALADILVGAINMPLTMVSVIEGEWKYGHDSCVIQGFFNIVSFIVSVISLAVISLNRYFYVVRWQTYTKTFSKKRTALYILLIWIFSVSLATPPLFGWGSYDYLPGKSFCFVNWSTDISYMYFMIGICFTGPLSCMMFSYYNILSLKKAVGMRLNQGPRNPISEMKQKRKEAEESKLTRTLLLVVGLFMLSWTPFVFAMFYNVYSASPLPSGVDFVTLLLGYFNSMCNPIVYCWRTETFYNGLKKICCRRDFTRSLQRSATVSTMTGVGKTKVAPAASNALQIYDEDTLHVNTTESNNDLS